VARRKLDLCVEGAEHIPTDGPAIVAARHFHHLYDGCAILSAIQRPVHIIVALDWVESWAGRFIMDRACRFAAWPVIMRTGGPVEIDELQAARAFRSAARESVALLRSGHVLLIFPEGYPNIDPGFTPKRGDSDFLAFHPGVVRIASLAAAQGLFVPIVPAGLAYERGERWKVSLRFGEPATVEHRDQEPAVLQYLERSVRTLSTSGPGHAPIGSPLLDSTV
jgi:putative membrane protein